MIDLDDTIVACSSPLGVCAISLIRVSSPDISFLTENLSLSELKANEAKVTEIELKKEEQLVFFEQIKPKNNNSNFSKLIEIAKDKLGPNIILKTILKKNDDSSFQIPLQGKYLEDIKSFDLDYSDQKNGSADALGQILDSAKRNK